MRKSWFRRLLLSYMPAFIVVITFVFFVCFQLISEQNRKDALQASKQLSLQTMRIVDASLKVIDNMVVLESINSKALQDFFNASADSNNYINIQAVQKLKEMIAYYPLIDSIYLVRNADGFVLSDATSSNVNAYRDKAFIEQYQFSQTAKWTDGRQFEQFTRIGSKQVISLVKGSSFMKNDHGMIVVNVSTDSLYKLTRDMYQSKVSFIQVKDTSGHLLFGSEIDVDQSAIYSHSVSSYTNWTYGSGLVPGGFVSTISYLYNLWFIIGLIMITLGFIWMIYVTRRNARPIEQIAARFSSYALPITSGGIWKGKPDEFAFIESAFDHVLEQFKQYQEKYQEDLHLKTRYLFHQLIEGNSSLTVSEWREEAIQLNLPQPLDTSRIFILEIDKYGDFCRMYSKSDQDLLKFTLRSVVDELGMKLEQILWSEWTTAANLSVMVLQSNTNDKVDNSAISLLAGQIIAWTSQNLKFSITIGMGEEAKTLPDIQRSYNSALKALSYKIVLGENRLISSEDISMHGSAEVYNHLGEIRSIVQSLRLLKDHWSEDYEQWFAQLKTGLLTNDEIFNLMNYLIYYIGREMSGMNTEIYNRWIQEGLPRLTERVDNGHTLEQLRDGIKQVLTEHYEAMRQMQDTKQYFSVICDIRKSIELEYSNPSMSLELLGERFDINAKYLSKLFKENTGQRFVDFLIDNRMEEAKRLLVETSYSIQEIAERVGYTNAISFRRVFKRTVGVSPGEYRTECALNKHG